MFEQNRLLGKKVSIFNGVGFGTNPTTQTRSVVAQDCVTRQKGALAYILQGSASRRVRKKIRLRRKMKDCCTWWSIGSRRGGLNKQIAMYFMSSKLYIEGYLYYYDHLVATPLTTKGRSWHVHRRCPPSPVLGNSESRSHLSHVNPLYKVSV